MTRQPAAGARRMRARHRRAGGEQGEVALGEIELLERLHRHVAAAEADAAAEERSLASATSVATGKLRSSSTLTIVSPTSPVAPTTATRNCLSMGCSSRARCARTAPARDVGRARAHVHVLRAVAQVVIHEHDRQHRFRDRRGAQPDARVVPPGGDDLHRVAGRVDGRAGDLDAGGGLERQVRDHVLTGGDATEDAAGVVAAEALRRQRIAMFAPLLRRGARAGADLDRLTALMLISAWAMSASRRRDRLAQARRHAARHDGDARTDRSRPRAPSR
jgi:hypothetical protein